jgi:hypothetical protein
VSHVPLKEACEVLEITEGAICASKKYKPFYHKSDPKKRKASFDLKGYRHREDIETQLTEKAKLFVEYLLHIENMTAKQIEIVAKVPNQCIYTHQFSTGMALRLVKAFAIHRPFHLKRFDEFYTWEHKARQTTKVFR